MHPTAAALLADINSGNHETALVLADWLEDHRVDSEVARLLRNRYETYLTRCRRAENRAARYRRQLAAKIERMRLSAKQVGAKFSVSYTASCEDSISRENALLVAYIRRRLAKLE